MGLSESLQTVSKAKPGTGSRPRSVTTLAIGRKHHTSRSSTAAGLLFRAEKFVFCDRATNTRRFEVEANPDGSLPFDEALSLLAMQCVVRGQAPQDFRIMIAVGEDLLDDLAPRTTKLVQHCMATALPFQLSQRQQQVLRGVLQNQSNKEIAAALNLAERTVKFHVSALLRKFHVEGRVALMQEAADMLSSQKAPAIRLPAAPVPLIPPCPARSIQLPPKLRGLAASDRRTR